MTRRQSVRVILFARGTLTGADGALRCAVVDLSAGGAMLTVNGRLPAPPLRLAFELRGETLELPVDIQRMPPGRGVAVSFPRPYSERLYRLIAEEQRVALAQGRLNVVDRRAPRSVRGPRGEAGPKRDDSLP